MPVSASISRLHTLSGLRPRYLPGPGDTLIGNEVLVATIWGNVAPGRQTLSTVTVDMPKFEYIDQDFAIPQGLTFNRFKLLCFNHDHSSVEHIRIVAGPYPGPKGLRLKLFATTPPAAGYSITVFAVPVAGAPNPPPR